MRVCAYCDRPIPTAARRDAAYCSKRCRQAAWRFRRQVAVGEEAAHPRRLAIADPPYLGLSGYYVGHPDYAGEVDHRALLHQLSGYDGWALCASGSSVPQLCALAAELGIAHRLAPWLRGSRGGETRAPKAAWEGVLYQPARRELGAWPDDALAHVARPMTTDPHRVIGAKPAAFSSWLFGLLGARRGDTLDDLFPGSGAIGRAWDVYTQASSPGWRDPSPGSRSDLSPEVLGDESCCSKGPPSASP